LVHFVLIGTLVFVVAHVIERYRQESQTRIVVDKPLEQRIAKLQLTQAGVLPDERQLRLLVESYIDDEVLYREALRLGLDQDDEIIRRRLIQKLEFLQRDATATLEPSEDQLRAHFSARSEQFSEPARVSFEHLYFSPDQGGEDQALRRADSARLALVGKANARPSDPFPLQDAYGSITRNDAAQLFGTSPFIDALFSIAPGEWSQPVRSGYGWHLIKVTGLIGSRQRSYEDASEDVRAAYLQEAGARGKRQQLDALRARYHVTYLNRGDEEAQ
jgi:peptidyl-prolyl cis-trans isomerase C